MSRYAFYGTLMEGEQRAGLLEGLGEFGGPCVIPGELYDLSAYPALALSSTGRVQGQLWYPADDRAGEAQQLLDVIEGTPMLFRRESIRLIEPDATVAWVYVWNLLPLPPLAHVWSGDWRRRAVAG